MSSVNAVCEFFSGGLWASVDGLITLATLFFVFRNWFNSRKLLKKIGIFFKTDSREIHLGLDIVRKSVTRSEIQGILSGLQRDPSKRYSITYLSNKRFLEDILLIQQGKLDRLVIEVTQEELAQFRIEDGASSGGRSPS